jgi:hypothetical protein
MEWVWELYKEYVTRQLERSFKASPDEERLEKAFLKILSESTVTVLVQEPWHNSVRFKGLAKYDITDMMALINDPMNYLLKNFGGGKFKLNFHHNELNFVGTRNFKPEGEPKWEDMPGIDF